MVLPAVILGVELVLAAVSVGTAVWGVLEGKKAVKEQKKNQIESAWEMKDIKVNNDLSNAPNSIPTS